MKECRICKYAYGSQREHCPVCGAAHVHDRLYIDTAYRPEIRVIVAAHGAERVGDYRTRMIKVTSCDPDQ